MRTDVNDEEPFSILCFGEDEIWGRAPGVLHRRLPARIRWPRVAQAELGSAYHLVEDGLPGRTTVWDDPLAGDVNGFRHLRTSLAAHAPIDLVILMVGSNDLLNWRGLNIVTIAKGVEKLARLVLAHEAWPGAGSPRLLLVAPPILDASFANREERNGDDSEPTNLPELLQELAAELGCSFLDSNRIAGVSSEDGRHLDAADHRAVGRLIARQITDLVGPDR